jgi:hypothetical protein
LNLLALCYFLGDNVIFISQVLDCSGCVEIEKYSRNGATARIRAQGLIQVIFAVRCVLATWRLTLPCTNPHAFSLKHIHAMARIRAQGQLSSLRGTMRLGG